MKNESKLPVEIIEWSGSKSFASLSAVEQNFVKKFISEEEYNEVFNTQKEVALYYNEDKTLNPSLNVKQKLDDAFRKKHAEPKSLWLQPVALWKVAAVFLVVFSASCLYLKKNAGSQSSTSLLVHDTIFVEKKIEAIKHILDTVVEYRYAGTLKESARKRSKAVFEAVDERKDTAILWRTRNENIGIRTLQPEDLIKELPNNNGKSMQEDELVKRFSYAKI